MGSHIGNFIRREKWRREWRKVLSRCRWRWLKRYTIRKRIPKTETMTMISLNDTHPAPKAVESYRVRKEAMDAAVFTLGPHARHGFEFETWKSDGRWLWRATEVDARQPTAAMIKADGGLRSLSACRGVPPHPAPAQADPALTIPLTGTCSNPARPSIVSMAAAIESGQVIKSMEGTPMADPNRLPVPPRRTLGKAAGASEAPGATEQPVAPENEPAVPPTALTATPVVKAIAVGDNIVYPDGSEGRVIGSFTMPACNGLDIAPHDDLAIPSFLKRDTNPEAKEKAAAAMKRIAKQVGPDRTIKNPPDAKAAAKRAEKAKAVEAKFEGTPEHAKAKRAGKAPVSAKAAKAKTAAPAKKLASEAKTKTAGHTIGSVARTAILKGKSNDEALAAVMKAFPDCSSNGGCMAWYRNKLKKEGFLKQDGTTSAKGEALLAGPTKAA